MFYIFLVLDFCPLKIKITQFHAGLIFYCKES